MIFLIKRKMPITTNAIKKEKTDFISPFRMILSGSSGAGKTHFAGELLKNKLFENDIEHVYYYHPCWMIIGIG